MRLRHPVRTILFDVGNTLVFLDHTRLGRVLEEQGHRRELVKIRAAEHLARKHVSCARRASAGASDASRWQEFLEAFVSAAEIELTAQPPLRRAIHAAHGVENLWRLVPPETRPTLEALRDAGIRLGVVSNADGRVAALLRELALEDLFDVIVDSHRVGIEKPNPAIFAMALCALEADPSSSLFVGDSYAIDVLGARAAGMTPALLDPLGIAVDVDCVVLRGIEEVLALVSAAEQNGERGNLPRT